MLSLVQRLEQSATRTPDSDAIVHGAERLCYRELWRRVQAFSAYLRRCGLPPQARVALLLENSSAYVVAYYGVMAAGGAVVALNTAAKAADLTLWLAHCGASIVVLDPAHPSAAAVRSWCSDRAEVIAIDAWQGIFEGGNANEAPVAVNTDRLAAIIYTSGTTGRPKGVMLSHGNLAANVESIQGYLALNASDRIVNVLPFYYSYGNSVLHTHLAVGGCVIIEDNLVYPHRVVERMVAERATGFAGVPSTFSLLLNRLTFADYDLRTLRYITQAGGAMPVAHIERLIDALPQVRLFVMYGQTEATARLSYLPPERLRDKIGSIGVAIPGVTLEVRNERGPAAASEVGEIWARGENIMLGYWNDAETTRQVLQDGWLKTGDMGYRDVDGYLYIEGRRSDMIKTGAHRIHPKEIEEVIAELDGIGEVAVIGVPDDILGQVIKAYLVIKPDAAVDGMRVKAHCRDRLAAYKIPKLIEFVSSLPKTASGKVQKFVLAANNS
ncbi:MAG: AMP-binding protein [Gammaproteobacteria bacterium]|nr:AMP-binding protein [Gammaproteobacteria bacterium]